MAGIFSKFGFVDPELVEQKQRIEVSKSQERRAGLEEAISGQKRAKLMQDNEMKKAAIGAYTKSAYEIYNLNIPGGEKLKRFTDLEMQWLTKDPLFYAEHLAGFSDKFMKVGNYRLHEEAKIKRDADKNEFDMRHSGIQLPLTLAGHPNAATYAAAKLWDDNNPIGTAEFPTKTMNQESKETKMALERLRSAEAIMATYANEPDSANAKVALNRLGRAEAIMNTHANMEGFTVADMEAIRSQNTASAQADFKKKADEQGLLASIKAHGEERGRTEFRRTQQSKAGNARDRIKSSIIYKDSPGEMWTARFQKAISAWRSVGKLEKILAEVDVNTGAFYGPWSKIQEMVKGGSPLTVLKAELNALIPNLARGIYGEVGVLTNEDVELYMKTVLSPNFDGDQNKLLLAMTRRTVEDAIWTTLEGAANSHRNVSKWVKTLEDFGLTWRDTTETPTADSATLTLTFGSAKEAMEAGLEIGTIVLYYDPKAGGMVKAKIGP